MSDFETKLNKLDEIANKLESGDLSLEDSLALYKEGCLLAESCKKTLEEAKITIEGFEGDLS